MSEKVTLWKVTESEVAGYSFDAVVEQVTEFTVDTPTYPVENGVSIADHRILQPIEYMIRGIVSNTPLRVSLFDFAGGLVSNLTDNPFVAAVAGMSAGFLAGSNSTRAAAAMENFVQIMEGAEPFDVDTGDMILKNMHIVRIVRDTNTQNENSAEITLFIRELVTLDRIQTDGQPTHKQLRSGSVEESGICASVSKGAKALKEVGQNTMDTITGWL